MAKLINVTSQTGYKLQLEFNDATNGVIGLSGLIGNGLFNALRDPALFEAATVGE